MRTVAPHSRRCGGPGWAFPTGLYCLLCFFLFLFSVLKSLFDNFCEQGLVEKPSERSVLCPSRGRCLHAGREPEPGWETRFRSSVQVPNGRGDRRAWAAEEGPGWTGFRSLSPAKPWGPWSGTGTVQCPCREGLGVFGAITQPSTAGGGGGEAVFTTHPPATGDPLRSTGQAL